MKRILYYAFALLLFAACSRRKEEKARVEDLTPQVVDNGAKIVFPTASSIAFFETETVADAQLDNEIAAPAKVSAIVVKSEETASQNIILFENPDLAANYTQLLQHLIHISQIRNINIKQKRTELERTSDLQLHGAATGKDLLEAQTALAMEETSLANEQAANIEHETKLKAGGFQAELLKHAKPGTAYIVCDIPENQISKIREKTRCLVRFTSFPNEKFNGTIEDFADMVDRSTRMVKLRVSLDNPNNKLKAGMFATVAFKTSEGTALSVDKNALVTIQAKNYVFVKSGSSAFIRRLVGTGNQVGDRIVVYDGLKSGERVAVKGAMQLKGLSFGY